MESKNELKEIDVKDSMFYYFDDIDSGNTLLDEKSNKTYENILICDML